MVTEEPFRLPLTEDGRKTLREALDAFAPAPGISGFQALALFDWDASAKELKAMGLWEGDAA